MTTQSPFETTRLPDLPPTQRLVIRARGGLLRLRRWAPGVLIGLGLALLLWGLLTLLQPSPTAARPLLPAADVRAQAAPTPPIVVPTAAAVAKAVPAPITVAASWAPGGADAGAVELVPGQVQLVETYQGWGRFRSAHMDGELWAPLAELAPALDAAQLLAAPEIAPTATPAPPPPPAPVQQQPAVVAAPAEAAPMNPIDGAGELVLMVDEPGRQVYQLVQPVEATPFPTPYYDDGGRTGGSWDD